MDTLTHALSGALVGRVLAGRRAPGAAAAASGASGTGFGAGFGASSAARPAVPVWQMVAAGTIAAIFPDLDPETGAGYGPSARRALKSFETVALLKTAAIKDRAA